MATPISVDYGERGTVVIFPDSDALAAAAAERIVAVTVAAAASHRRAIIALSGGSTPKHMGQLLATEEYSSRVQWNHLEVFWGDERWVPLDNAESNAGEALRGFLDASPILVDRLHPFNTSLADPAVSASIMERTIRDTMTENGVSRFDLVMLGMGDDGHTASMFPGTTAMHESARWVIAHRVPKLNAIRLTFTPPLINAAAEAVFLTSGSGKSSMLHQVLDGAIDIDKTPSQVVRPTSGDLVWLIDRAAATQLERVPQYG